MTAAISTGLRIDLLGPLRAERDGVEADLGGPKQRAVLAMLLSEPMGSIGRDRIIEGVWGEAASDANRHSFYTYLSNLRSVLGDVIVRTGETYRLDLEADDIDHLVFAWAVEEARRTLATDPGAAAIALREALGLWRGRPYADLVDFPGLDPEVRRLEELRLEAVELRIDAELASGLHGSLIAELEALAEENPTRERFRAQHMLALYRSGRQSEALRAFRKTESFLAEELGVDPSQELRDLELKILEQDESLLDGASRTVTQRLAFLVTDIEGSTRLWDQHPQEMASALAEHDRVLREAIESEGGTVFKHTGDGVLAAIPNGVAAAGASERALRALQATDWGEVGKLKVRVGIDVGEVESRGGDFFGPPVNRAARLCALGHGGQVLVSSSVLNEVSASAPTGLQVHHLGEVHLRGMAVPEPVAQLVFVGLPADFPELRTHTESALDDPTEMISLPGYEVRDRVGEGAFGVVWRAYQPSVGREVAVKVIRPEFASRASFVRRFEAEARTIARLAHPHIVPLIDFWRDTDSAYLVLALLSGGSLAQTVESRDVDRASARKMLGQLGAALDHAHSRGMVHGDVKPSNVLLDGSGNAYLADFGIAARLLYPETAVSASLAPQYRAPEETETGPTPATDLFALGVLAREMLDGLPDLEGVLARATAANPGDRYPSAAGFLADLDNVLGAETTHVEPAVVSRNPYKGLRAFEEGDAPDFHGRGELVATLVAAVSERRFVTVVGPSGSGKSSVVKAGLLPELSNGAVDGSDRWFRVVFTPGPDPLVSLADAVESVSTDEVTAESLVGSELHTLVDGDLLLVIDQFEETYTLAGPEERRVFLDLLADAVEAPDSSVRVVATLRADFYDRPLEDGRLGRLVRDGLVTVLPPTRDELIETITAPSQAVGLRWEPGLPHRLAEDVAHQAGGLPLLQYALTELVEHRGGDLLTSSDYQDIGGVAGALVKRAELIHAEFEPSQQHIARQVLLRLVTVDEDSDDIRRRVRRSELETMGITRSDLDTVLDRFTTQRLFLADRDPATRGPTVEVAHEALIREWPRLQGWIEGQREALILGRRFRAALDEWEHNDRDDDYLLVGSRLAPFAGWAETARLTSHEEGYYRASRDKDQEQHSARRRRRRTLTGILTTAAIVATTLGILAAIQAGRATTAAERATAEAERALVAEAEAEIQAEVARGRELSSAAQAALATDPSLAKLLALASADLVEPSVDALSVLHQAYAHDPVIDRYIWPERDSFFSPELHPGGNRLVGSSALPGPKGYIEVYDFDLADTLWSWETGHPNIVLDEAAFSPDGSVVVAGAYWRRLEPGDGEPPPDRLGIHIWDGDTGELLRRIDLGRCGGKVQGMSTDSFLVTTLDPEECGPPLYGGNRFAIEVVDIESGERLMVSPLADWPATMSADGRYVAFTEVPREAPPATVVVELASGDRVLEFDPRRPNSWAGAGLLNQDGSLLIAAGQPMEVWDVEKGSLIATFSGHGGQHATPWAFSPDGISVYSTSVDSTLRIWDATRGTETSAYLTSGYAKVSLADRGRVLVTNADAYEASLLDLTPGEVWGLPTCGGFIHGRSLKTVNEYAVLNELCAGNVALTYLVDMSAREITATFGNNDGQDVAISPDGTRFVRQESGEPPPGAPESGDDRRWVSPPRIRDLLTGELLVEFDGVCTWDRLDHTPRWEQPGCAPFPAVPFPLSNFALQWSPDTSQVAALLPQQGIAVWDAESGSLVGLVESPCRIVGPNAFLFTAGGEELVISCIGDGLLASYSTEAWEGVRTAALEDGIAGRESFAFIVHRPEHDLILGVGGTGVGGEAALHWLDDGSFEVVDSISAAHAGPAVSWAASYDGSLAATGSSDGLVKVWDVAERRLTQEIFVGSEVQGVAFIDNNHLAVTPQTGGFYVYTLDPDELLDIVRSSLIRGFTHQECQRYNFGDDCPTLEQLRGDN